MSLLLEQLKCIFFLSQKGRMWLLADMKNVMADLQVSNSWSFGNQRWLGLPSLHGLPSLLAHVC